MKHKVYKYVMYSDTHLLVKIQIYKTFRYETVKSFFSSNAHSGVDFIVFVLDNKLFYLLIYNVMWNISLGNFDPIFVIMQQTEFYSY